MSYRAEGFYKITQINGDKFFGKAMDTWETEYVFQLPNGRKRILSKVGYQFMDEVTKEEWAEVLQKAQNMAKTQAKGKPDQAPAEVQA